MGNCPSTPVAGPTKRRKKRRSHRETPLTQTEELRETTAEEAPPLPQEIPTVSEALISIMSSAEHFTDDPEAAPCPPDSPSPLLVAPIVALREQYDLKQLRHGDRKQKAHDPQRIYNQFTGALEKIPSVDQTLIGKTCEATLTVRLEGAHWIGYLTNITDNAEWLLGAYSQEHLPIHISQLIPERFRERHQRWMDTLFHSTKGGGFETFAQQMLTKRLRLRNLQPLSTEETSPYHFVFMDFTPLGLVPRESFNFRATFIESEQLPRFSRTDHRFFATQTRERVVKFQGEFETDSLEFH